MGEIVKMKIKDLIAKLQKFDQNLEVVIEPSIDSIDNESNPDKAVDAYQGSLKSILCRIGLAQKDDEENYCFDSFEKSDTDKKVLIISDEYFKYGEGE
jgi:hypothetical protein